jgi:hypothetical protein
MRVFLSIPIDSLFSFSNFGSLKFPHFYK